MCVAHNESKNTDIKRYYFSSDGNMPIVNPTSCCQYGMAGMNKEGFDCLIIPGAEKKTADQKFLGFTRICGRKAGLATANGMNNKDICCEYGFKYNRF